jgi:Sec-independent protein translocase protein TatA
MQVGISSFTLLVIIIGQGEVVVGPKSLERLIKKIMSTLERLIKNY